MNAFETAIKFFAELSIETPTLYGWFHMCWLAITALSCTLVFCMRKRITQKQMDVTLIVWGTALVFIETARRLVQIRKRSRRVELCVVGVPLSVLFHAAIPRNSGGSPAARKNKGRAQFVSFVIRTVRRRNRNDLPCEYVYDVGVYKHTHNALAFEYGNGMFYASRFKNG